ncbi:MAG: pyridoxal-phosphate dependent enzyme, partial [Anaerolineales bacterium]|nr:pyridoxal-phosphate dependent enzyme [Anaerolineales bacterium]MDW8227113.1 pyridoxal-phosphate dependent enzyme [Anaerolineales bacterium]
MYGCLNCRRSYPSSGLPYSCPVCGGIYDDQALWAFDPLALDATQPGIWRYRHTFGLPPEQEPVSLGEGRTPLVLTRLKGRKVYFKCEYHNPTGSFKDRGSALLIAWAKARSATEIIEDSSGNAGASLAAYAGRAGMRVRIYVPSSASGPKLRQIEMYGAELCVVDGPRSAVAEAARRVAQEGAVYVSHAYLPFNLRGYATIAYEIWEQLGGRLPGAILVPAGQGGLLLGLARGFQALQHVAYPSLDRSLPSPWPRFHFSLQRRRHDIPSFPRLIGVQAR